MHFFIAEWIALSLANHVREIIKKKQNAQPTHIVMLKLSNHCITPMGVFPYNIFLNNSGKLTDWMKHIYKMILDFNLSRIVQIIFKLKRNFEKMTWMYEYICEQYRMQCNLKFCSFSAVTQSTGTTNQKKPKKQVCSNYEKKRLSEIIISRIEINYI